MSENQVLEVPCNADTSGFPVELDGVLSSARFVPDGISSPSLIQIVAER